MPRSPSQIGPREAAIVANAIDADMTSPEIAARDMAIGLIARANLDIETLDTRNSDSLDFHDLAVWAIRAALEQAYDAGRASLED